jgi:hypothetical protein
LRGPALDDAQPIDLAVVVERKHVALRQAHVVAQLVLEHGARVADVEEVDRLRLQLDERAGRQRTHIRQRDLRALLDAQLLHHLPQRGRGGAR